MGRFRAANTTSAQLLAPAINAGLAQHTGVILPVKEPARIKLRFQHKAMATLEGNALE